MWTCPTCRRKFEKTKQPHSCRSIPLGEHFKNKPKAKELYDSLVKQVRSKIGKCHIISIPCCIHLFGTYDFLAALPKKDCLEIHFGFDRKLHRRRIKACVQVSARMFTICLDLHTKRDIDGELIGWLDRAYHLREKKR